MINQSDIWSKHEQNVTNHLLGIQEFIPNLPMNVVNDANICRYWLKGLCKFGNKCRFKHELSKSIVSQEESDIIQREIETRSTIHLNDKECSICMEKVIAKGKQFGILMTCEHPFCLECIRQWRNDASKTSKDNARSCPICRANSW